MVWNRLKLWTVLAFWFMYTLAWLEHDQLIRDGDEDGHIGAAEIFKGILEEQGPLNYLQAIWYGDYGDYPNLFAGLLGGWWALINGQPEGLAFQAFPILGAGLTCLGIWFLLKEQPQARFWGVILIFLTPMTNGLFRHAMPEGLVMGFLVLTLGLGFRLLDNPNNINRFIFGLILGLGALTKHNFIVLGFIPIAWLVIKLRTHAILPLIIATITAGPWYALVGLNKQAYVQNTFTDMHIGWHSIFAHPLGILWDGLGPIVAIALLISIKQMKIAKRAQVLAYWWLFGGLVLLCLLPKQYPRLLLPLIPGAILIIAPWISQQKKHTQFFLLVLSGLFLHIGTLMVYPVNPLYQMGDDGCSQHWLRPPVPTDFGLQRITEVALQSDVDGVVVEDDLEIPCEVQTTHSGYYHLEYYLRRHQFLGTIETTRPSKDGRWLIVSWENASSENNWQPETTILLPTE